jgi:Ser/Thr protein kinase RdoA (MazF antagonist)
MLESILSRFDLSGRLVKVERFGSGLINETYLAEFNDSGTIRKYILQRINKTVFRRPDFVMENVEIVTGHLQKRLRQEGVADPASVTPALVRTAEGRSFYADESGEYWRVFHFIETGVVFDTVQDVAHAREVGRGLGRFQALVADLPPEQLHDTLPGFHNTPRYLVDLDAVMQDGGAEHLAGVREEIAFVQKRRGLAGFLSDLMESGRIPLRVVHNDPKVSNILIHAQTGKALCMIDLDTVMPGIVHFDFGDCVRSAANTAGEDARDLDTVVFDQARYDALREGYLDEAGVFLTQAEIDMLPVSAKVITFELGIRFLTDHLRGNIYFRARYPGHNLHRCRVQFRLHERMEAANL